MQIKNMNMELPYAYEKPINNVHVLHHGNSSSRLFVIIRHSESRTLLKILAQASLLALLIMILAGVFGGSTNRETNNNNNNNNFVLPNTNNYLKLITSHHENVALMSISSILPPLIFQDLANEGLLTIKDKTLIVVDNTKAEQVLGFTVSPSNKKQQDSIRNQTFTFTFTNCYNGAMEGFVDRTLKTGGVMVVQLRRDPSVTSFQVPPNYKIVYFRKLNNNSTFIAMRKLSSSSSSLSSSSSSSWRSRRLLQFLSEEKKAILGNLEDVLLEPPRSATGKSKTYLRKTKFLPDLLNDSLEGYSRRVYIDVGGTGHGSTRWFEQNYPTRNKDFDMYRIETVPETEVESDDAWEGPPTQMGISDWLWRNVKAEEYVVMKADAEVVEEMLKSKAIALVDELFLECKPIGKGGNNKRAYWECLALYGRLRDFGVAVHQWWG